MAQSSWLKTKKITGVFSGVALFVGFIFLDKGITGNVILNNQVPVGAMSLIGLGLVLCSGILAAYTIKK